MLRPQVGLELVGLDGERAGQRHLAPAPDELGLQHAHAGLLEEAVVVAKARADLGGFGREVPARRAHAPGGVQVVAALARAEGVVAAPRGHRAGAPALRFVRPPVEIQAGHAVARAAVDLLARGRQRADAELLAVPASAQQRGLRAPLLRQQRGAVGPRAAQQAAAIVAQRQRGGIGAGAAPGGAQTPAGIGDGARVEGHLGQRDHVLALEEERPLLRNHLGEAGVDGELRYVELDLREVGVEGGVEHPVGARPPLDLRAQRSARLAGTQPQAVVAARRAQRQLGPHRQQGVRTHALGDVGQAADLLQLVEDAQRVLREGRAHQQDAFLARDAARGHDAPGRAALVGVAQRHQRQAQLDAVAVGQALHGGVELEVGREVLLLFGAGEEHAVGHHTGGADAHELRGAARAHRVDQHRDEVLVALDLVAAHQRRTDLLGARIPGADADHQRMLLDHQLQRGAVARGHRLAVQRQVLHEGLVQRRGGPGGIVEPAVDAQRRHLGARAEGLRLRRRIGQAEQRGQQGARQCGERLHSPWRRLRGRPASTRSSKGLGSSRISLATTPICQGMTR